MRVSLFVCSCFAECAYARSATQLQTNKLTRTSLRPYVPTLRDVGTYGRKDVPTEVLRMCGGGPIYVHTGRHAGVPPNPTMYALRGSAQTPAARTRSGLEELPRAGACGGLRTVHILHML